MRNIILPVESRKVELWSRYHVTLEGNRDSKNKRVVLVGVQAIEDALIAEGVNSRVSLVG